MNYVVFTIVETLLPTPFLSHFGFKYRSLFIDLYVIDREDGIIKKVLGDTLIKPYLP